MENNAPIPIHNSIPQSLSSQDIAMKEDKNPSVVGVTIVGTGGAGINRVREVVNDQGPYKTLFFDTSLANSRHGESVYVLTNGSGSGSHRAENARDIEREVPQLSDEELGVTDVAVVVFSLSGGSGSVLSPILLREYHKRGTKVIAIAIADTSYSVGAKNTLNTLKTLNAICKNNDLYLPLVLLSNDHAGGRRKTDEACTYALQDIIDILTRPVYEIDRNDRLNWINPTKVVNSAPGVKILSFVSDRPAIDSKIMLGTDSKEMVDSLLILQSNHDEGVKTSLPPARLKKVGIYYEKHRSLVGKISSDVTSIEQVIDYVEKMQHQDVSQKHLKINRLETSGNDDLIL